MTPHRIRDLERRAAELLARIPPPKRLDSAAVARIHTKLLMQRGPSGTRPWVPLLAGVSALASLGTLIIGLHLALRPHNALPAGNQRTALAPDPRLELPTPEPPAGSEPPRPVRSILTEGRLTIRAQHEAQQVVAGSVVITIPPGASADIEVLSLQVKVAAFGARVTAVSVQGGDAVHIDPGAVWVHPVEEPAKETLAPETSAADMTAAVPSQLPSPAKPKPGPKAPPRIVTAVTRVDAQAPRPARIDGGGPSPLASESQLLAAALRRLRHDRDPKAALALLDDYRARHPDGALSKEEVKTRVEALAALGQKRAALKVLEPLDLGGSQRDHELWALRGELRAAAGRCNEAIADFTALYSTAQQETMAERALFGRLVCLRQQGSKEALRHDVDRYLSRFPKGAHAGQVRAWK